MVCWLALAGTSSGAPAPRLLILSVRGHGDVYLNTQELVACSGSCHANYRSRTATLALTARPSAGWQFAHWLGGCGGTYATCTLSVGASTQVAAVFKVIPPIPAPAVASVPIGPIVTVTATEFDFVLSTTTVPVGTVTFEVINAGTLPHDFEICGVPSDGTATSCTGSATGLIAPSVGPWQQSSAFLTVAFTAPGTYEYLCTVPGHAAAGMRGLITVA
jgi:plastocyanin